MDISTLGVCVYHCSNCTGRGYKSGVMTKIVFVVCLTPCAGGNDARNILTNAVEWIGGDIGKYPRLGLVGLRDAVISTPMASWGQPK